MGIVPAICGSAVLFTGIISSRPDRVKEIQVMVKQHRSSVEAAETNHDKRIAPSDQRNNSSMHLID